MVEDVGSAEQLPGKNKILLICESREKAEESLGPAIQSCETVVVQNPLRAWAEWSRGQIAGIFIDSEHFREAFELGKLLQNEQTLDEMPDGVVVLDGENTIVWANRRLQEWCGGRATSGAGFYAALGSPEILGPDYCPFHTALASAKAAISTLRTAEGRYYQVHAAPVREIDAAGQQLAAPQHLIVTVRDVTNENLQQQKLAAIHQAGMELADLTPEELSHMTVEQRIELLKANILHYTKDLLHFDVVEIRLLDQKTGRLEPLVQEGMSPDAASRVLYAQPQDNGVTGFVAATGKSYFCEDTTKDPLYLEGAIGARSSLTVPLGRRDQVVGTFNVESPEPRAFVESDLQFLEIFGHNVAMALNTLELLVAEKATAAAASVDAIHSAVALPVDEILNDAVNVMERYIGHELEVVERLQRILRNARDIKQVIQAVGLQMSPAQAHPLAQQAEDRPLLRGRRVLVADADENVRSAAHALLERYGCVVETAPDGGEAFFMIRSLLRDGGYDAVIADIRLPDMTGYEFYVRLREIMEPVPMILMTGFGYDPGHSIVKARQAGLQAVLYKPFRVDQLLQSVETIIAAARPVAQT